MVSLHAFVLAAALTGSNDTVLLHFTADWCGPCRLMQPTVQRLHDAGYPLREVNVDREADLTRQFRVGPIPCFVLVRNGREVDRIVGQASYDRLARMFEPPGNPGLPRDRAAGSGDPIVRGQSPDDRSSPLGRLPERGTLARDNPRQPPPTPGRDPGQRVVTQSSPIHQQALQATVRLRISDPTGQSHGTGTIIDVHGDEALVLTCGHIFRESRGQGEISVELCVPGATGPVRGQLLAFEAEQRDIGLVSIRPGVAVRPVRVASTDYYPQKGEPVFSVGCDHGADPTVQESTISAINRYTGAPNLEIHGHPVEGRSGGGLFSADGRLIGVCNAADLQEDRGIYAGLPTIHYELKAINQERIYATDPALPSAALVRERGVESTASPAPLQNVSVPLQPQASASATEVICILRSRGQAGRDERVMVVDQPSAALLRLLEQEAQGQSRDPARLQGPPAIMSASRQQPSAVPPPVVRAQNY
jgi:thiol-disulfide isomerase/thioredoxin